MKAHAVLPMCRTCPFMAFVVSLCWSAVIGFQKVYKLPFFTFFRLGSKGTCALLHGWESSPFTPLTSVGGTVALFGYLSLKKVTISHCLPAPLLRLSPCLLFELDHFWSHFRIEPMLVASLVWRCPGGATRTASPNVPSHHNVFCPWWLLCGLSLDFLAMVSLNLAPTPKMFVCNSSLRLLLWAVWLEMAGEGEHWAEWKLAHSWKRKEPEGCSTFISWTSDGSEKK